MESDAIEFWDECDLVSRDPEIVHGEPVLKGTRLPVDTLVGNVQAFIELRGMNELQAIEATLDCFPSTPGGADTIHKLLAYRAAHLHQLVP